MQGRERPLFSSSLMRLQLTSTFNTTARVFVINGIQTFARIDYLFDVRSKLLIKFVDQPLKGEREMKIVSTFSYSSSSLRLLLVRRRM